MKKSHKALKIVLLILFILIVASVCLLIWQKDNISAVISASKYSDTDIQQQIDESKKNIETQLEQYDVKGLRDFTLEEEEAIRKGTLTVEEAVKRIMSESNISGAEQGSGVLQENEGQNQNENENEQSSTAIVSDYTIKLYSLKAAYLGQIGNLIDQAKADFKNGASGSTLMSKYLSKAASLESEADSKVDTLLNELTGKLENIGADTSIVATMRDSYENEKSLKKSYYLSLFNKKKKG
ncbi:MAG: hypothetical protein Q4D26_08660 [Clostridia bacterium]|nr:hypothetical protein [Clostridia bacterium]